MIIRCDKCSVEHDLEPPAWVVETGRAFRFRCATCGHSHLVDVAADSNTRPEEQARKPASSDIYLKQDGRVYLVKTWHNLQKWVEEGRVSPEDLVSEGALAAVAGGASSTTP